MKLQKFMQIVAIGKPLFEGRDELPEAIEYNYQAGDHTLLLSMKNLHPSEIKAVREEPAEFGLYCEDGIIFLLYRFGEILPWSDSAFSWWNVAEEDRRIPEQRKHPAEEFCSKSFRSKRQLVLSRQSELRPFRLHLRKDYTGQFAVKQRAESFREKSLRLAV